MPTSLFLETMTRILIIAILLSGCATDINRAQSMAVLRLKQYDLSNVKLNPVIITKESRNDIPGGQAGFYDPIEKEIYLLRNCPDYVAVHEFQHYFLDSIGIPCYLHHGIINR